MALPQVGLEAVIAGLPGFNAGAAAITKAYDEIEKKGSNVAKASNILGSSISSVASPFVNLGQSVLNFGKIAGETALIGVGALTAGIAGLGVLAVGEFSKYERMSLSITNLVAREISQGQMVEQQIQTRISLTKKENEELSALPQKIKDEELSRNTLAAQIQEQKQKIIDLTAAYGDNGLNVQTAKNRLAEMENEYSKSGQEIDKLNGRIAELNNKNGQLTTTLQKVRTGQMSMTDAMAQAGPRAAELLKWIQILAIQSPFTQEGVANAFRTALAYGFTTEQAQRITSAMIDFTSATGKSEESANLIALALGQIQARGKLSAQELRQLSEQGVGVNKILEDMGFSLDDVTNGLVPVDKFIEATIKDMEVFKGAAKAQSTTFAGLIASLSDLKSIGLREFFTGTFNAIQPYAASFVEWLTNAALQTGSIKKVGESLGQYVGGALKTISDLVAQFQRWGPEGIFAAMGFKSSSLFIAQIKSLWNLITSQGPSAQSIFESIGGVIKYLQQNAFPLLTKAVSFVMNNFESFKGALMGIGAVLATGVFAAIIAGLLALLTPINLIIAAAALLGAAWMGNWFGIRDITGKVIGYITNLVNSFQKGGLFGTGKEGGLLAALGISDKTIKIVQFRIAQITQLLKTFSKGGLFGNAGKGGLLAALGLDPAVVATVQNIISTITKDIQLLWTAFGSGDMSAIGTVGQFIGQQLSTIWTNYIQPQLNQWGVMFMDWVGVVYTNIPTVLTNLVTSISNFLVQAWPIVLSTLSTWGTQFWNWVLGAVQNAGNYLGQLINQIVTWANSPEVQNYMIQGGMIIGQHFMSSILTFLQQTAPALVTGLTYLIAGGLEYLAQGAVLLGQHLINSLNIFFQQGGPGLVTTLSYLVAGLLAAVATIAGTLFNLGTNLVAGILAGILNAFGANLQPATLSELGNILIGIGNNIVTIARIIGTQIVTGIRNGWTATVQTVVTAFTDGVNAWTDIITKSNWFDVGASIIKGLLAGIEKNMGLVLKTLKDLALEAVKDAMTVLGISSPSTVFAKMGENIMLGLMTGIDTGSKDFNKKLSGALQNAIDLSGQLTKNMVGQKQQIRNIFTGWVASNQDKLASLTGPQLKASIVQYANAFGGNAKYIIDEMVKRGYDFNKLAGELKNTYSSFMRELRLAAIGTSLSTANQFLSFGQGVADRLKNKIDTLQELVDAGGGEYLGTIYNEVEAQNLLNAALADQVAAQKEINDLAKQQADLQFLQQQADILKLVQDRGLDASQIFKGVTFGLDASLPDLIKATSNVVQAMIDQINADLQIASPSKVMARIGAFMNKGLAQGILDTMNIPVQALNNVINVPIGQAGGGNSSVVNETNYNFSMAVNSGASPQGVIQQFQVMRAMLA